MKKIIFLAVIAIGLNFPVQIQTTEQTDSADSNWKKYIYGITAAAGTALAGWLYYYYKGGLERNINKLFNDIRNMETNISDSNSKTLNLYLSTQKKTDRQDLLEEYENYKKQIKEYKEKIEEYKTKIKPENTNLSSRVSNMEKYINNNSDSIEKYLVIIEFSKTKKGAKVDQLRSDLDYLHEKIKQIDNQDLTAILSKENDLENLLNDKEKFTNNIKEYEREYDRKIKSYLKGKDLDILKKTIIRKISSIKDTLNHITNKVQKIQQQESFEKDMPEYEVKIERRLNELNINDKDYFNNLQKINHELDLTIKGLKQHGKLEWLDGFNRLKKNVLNKITEYESQTPAKPETPNTIGIETIHKRMRHTLWRYDIINTLQKEGYEQANPKANNSLSGFLFILKRNNEDIPTLNHLQEDLIKENEISADDAIYTIKLMGHEQDNFEVPYYVAINPKTLVVKGLIKQDTYEWIDPATQEEMQQIEKPAPKKSKTLVFNIDEVNTGYTNDLSLIKATVDALGEITDENIKILFNERYKLNRINDTIDISFDSVYDQDHKYNIQDIKKYQKKRTNFKKNQPAYKLFLELDEDISNKIDNFYIAKLDDYKNSIFQYNQELNSLNENDPNYSKNLKNLERNIKSLMPNITTAQDAITNKPDLLKQIIKDIKSLNKNISNKISEYNPSKQEERSTSPSSQGESKKVTPTLTKTQEDELNNLNNDIDSKYLKTLNEIQTTINQLGEITDKNIDALSQQKNVVDRINNFIGGHFNNYYTFYAEIMNEEQSDEGLKAFKNNHPAYQLFLELADNIIPNKIDNYYIPKLNGYNDLITQYTTELNNLNENDPGYSKNLYDLDRKIRSLRSDISIANLSITHKPNLLKELITNIVDLNKNILNKISEYEQKQEKTN